MFQVFELCSISDTRGRPPNADNSALWVAPHTIPYHTLGHFATYRPHWRRWSLNVKSSNQNQFDKIKLKTSHHHRVFSNDQITATKNVHENNGITQWQKLVPLFTGTFPWNLVNFFLFQEPSQCSCHYCCSWWWWWWWVCNDIKLHE